MGNSIQNPPRAGIQRAMFWNSNSTIVYFRLSARRDTSERRAIYNRLQAIARAIKRRRKGSVNCCDMQLLILNASGTARKGAH